MKNEDPDLESTLYQTFTVETDVYGETIVHELIPDGGEIYVNQENKAEYVYLFIDYIFNHQCEEQFKSFKRGFFKVVTEDIISLFKPEELELLICGSKTLDFKELQNSCQYVDGYTEDHEIMKWLWEIVNEDMTDTERR